MSKDAIYYGKSEVRTYVHLYYAAKSLVRRADEEPRGSTYTVMGALVLAAFTFEAYLNHLGERGLKFWTEIESIRVLQKYSVLCKHFGVCPDFSRRPYQTLERLFKFRNEMAHAKSQTLEIEKLVQWDDDSWEHQPVASWETYCTLKEAKRATADVSKVIKELHVTAGFGDAPFVHGVGTFLVRPIVGKQN